MTSAPTSFPPFSAAYAPDDRAIAPALLKTARLSAEQDARIDHIAARLIDAIRSSDDRLGGVEDMLREFALSTKEGLALMVLAQALLRVPGPRTAPRAIRSTCSAKARAPPMMRRAISIPMRARSTPSAPPPVKGPCPTGPASRSSSPRCIRALRP